MDGDAGIMVGIGNDITAVAEIIDSCIVTPIVAILREIHIQGIAASDSVTRWFFIKNAAIYSTTIRVPLLERLETLKIPPSMVPEILFVKYRGPKAERNLPPVMMPEFSNVKSLRLKG